MSAVQMAAVRNPRVHAEIPPALAAVVGPTTKILAIGSVTAKGTPEAIAPVLPFEVRATVRNHFGTIRAKGAHVPLRRHRLSWATTPAPYSFGRIVMDEDRFNIALRKFLKIVGITSQREFERVVREGKVEGAELKLRMTLTAENAPLDHVVEETIDLR